MVAASAKFKNERQKVCTLRGRRCKVDDTIAIKDKVVGQFVCQLIMIIFKLIIAGWGVKDR